MKVIREVIEKIFYAFYIDECKRSRGLPELHSLLPIGLIGFVGSCAILFFIEWTLEIDIFFSSMEKDVYGLMLFLVLATTPYIIFYTICVKQKKYLKIDMKYKHDKKISNPRIFKYVYAAACYLFFIVFGYLRFKGVAG